MMSRIITRMDKTKSTWRTSRRQERRWSINRIGITKSAWILIVKTTIGPDNPELESKISTFIQSSTLSLFILLPNRLSRSLKKSWRISWLRKEEMSTRWWIFGASKNSLVGRSLQIWVHQTSKTFLVADWKRSTCLHPSVSINTTWWRRELRSKRPTSAESLPTWNKETGRIKRKRVSRTSPTSWLPHKLTWRALTTSLRSACSSSMRLQSI